MTIYAVQERTIYSALHRLAKKLGDPDVLNIPIAIVDDKKGGYHPASTDASHIMLSERIIKEDPLNLEVYIAHEIFHDVVNDVSITHRFSADVMNCAEDYLINCYLKSLYGYDVLRVVEKGMYDQKYEGMKLVDIAIDVKKTSLPSKQHFKNSHKHPVITSVAGRLKKALGINQHADLVVYDYDETFLAELRKEYDTFNFSNLPNVNPDVVISNLWARFYSPVTIWADSTLGSTLTQSQTLILAPVVQAIDGYDAEFALFCTRHLLNAFNDAQRVLHIELSRLQDCYERYIQRRDKLIRQLRFAKKRLKIVEIQTEIVRIDKSVANLKKKVAVVVRFPPLTSLLAKPTDIACSAPKRLHSLAATLDANTHDEPRFSKKGVLVKQLRFIQKLVGNPSELKKIYEDFYDFAGDLLSRAGQEPSYDDGDSSDDVGDSRDGTGVEDPERSVEQPESNEEQPQGTGAGKSPTANLKLQVLNIIATNPKLFKSILRSANDFGEKLLLKSSTKISETCHIDRTLTFGNDLSRVTHSDLGKLGNKFTKLLFLVELANSSLLQYSGTDPRRSPLILILDCSGSMSGKCYEIAAGFCLCLIKKLHDSKRGCALVKFSSQVDEVMIWDANQGVSFLQLMNSLANPSLGGTNFDQALSTAYDIHKKQGWSRSQVLMVTDGYDTVSPSVTAAKPVKCRTTVVLVSNKATVSGVDECVHVERKNLAIELVKTGNRLL